MDEKLESQKVKPMVDCQSWDSNPGLFDFGAHIFHFMSWQMSACQPVIHEVSDDDFEVLFSIF